MIFFIHVLDKKLAYRVDQINVIRPEDTRKLQIIDGKDYVTLLTCTPYGVNDHRLLVRGIRTEYHEKEELTKRKTASFPVDGSLQEGDLDRFVDRIFTGWIKKDV